MKKIKLFAFSLIATIGFTSCGSDEPTPAIDDNLDATQTAIITQFVKGVVVPTYKSLADEAIALSDACADLKAHPSQANVEKACEKWIAARKYWEQSEAFLYGAASDYYIDPHIDSWPLKKSLLDSTLANDDLMAELDEDGAGAEGFATLGYGLLGFHAVEYVLFRDGQARDINDISAKELIFNAAVAEDLANQTALLEAGWSGFDNVTAEKRKMLEEAELVPSVNYGEQMISAGTKGNAVYKTQISALVGILAGASSIADEVGNTKITDPVNSGNVLDVESWYSWNSIADFSDNILSVRNAYYGSTDGKVNAASLSNFVKKADSSLDKKIVDAISKAYTVVSGMPAPFRNHLTKAETQAAVDACNELVDVIDFAIESIQ